MITFCKAALALGFKDMCGEQLQASDDFLEHVANHGLSYGTHEEFIFRQEIFNQKTAEYAKINADPKNTFTVGHNFMSTWTKDEYKKLLGYKAPQNATELEIQTFETVDTPTAKDWRQYGAVNAVKDQAQCGSCWAFSATSAMESAQFIQKGGQLLSLSEQQLTSCDTYSHGCNGGLQSNAFYYVENYGQVQESQYPYTSGNGNTGQCQSYKTKNPSVQVSAYYAVQKYSSGQLLGAIAQQPISVTIEADQPVFQGYTGGIMNSASCGTNLDHAVTAVGYGNQNGQYYYIVRNSWGPSWGSQGYIYIAAVDGGAGICGIQQTSVYPKMR